MVATRDDGNYRHTVNAFTKPMREQVERQIRYSKALEYDLNIIPKRVRNQTKAVSLKDRIPFRFSINLSLSRSSTSLSKGTVNRILRSQSLQQR
jgi:hypothetical protein